MKASEIAGGEDRIMQEPGVGEFRQHLYPEPGLDPVMSHRKHHV